MDRNARARLRDDLRRITGDGIAFSIMVGAGETYLAAFVLALGMGEVTAGLIASVPMLAGAVIQLISPAMVRLLRSHRRWVVGCAVIQALTFVPLVIAAIVGEIPKPAIFLIATIYWGSGMATGPAWNTWVGTLIPKRIRAHYFGVRSRWAHMAVLVGLLTGGLLLQAGKNVSVTLTAFAILFTIAGVCRGVSAIYLGRQSEPEPPDQNHREVPWRELVKRLRHSHDGRLLAYMLVFQTAVQIAGPFFTPYMLGEMHMSYWMYLVLIGTAYTARVLTLPTIGRLVHRLGPQPILWASGFGIIRLSSLWIISDSFVYLFFVQLLSGAIWGAYELTTLLLFFDTIPEEERTSILTTFNLGNSLAMVVGATIGATILDRLGSDHTAYMVIFGISGLARIMTIPLLVRAVKVLPRVVVPDISPEVPTRIMAVRPNLGSIERPVLSGLPRVDVEAGDAVITDESHD